MLVPQRQADVAAIDRLASCVRSQHSTVRRGRRLGRMRVGWFSMPDRGSAATSFVCKGFQV